MPVTAILHLRCLTEGKVTRSFHCLMHPVFLDILTRTDPDLAGRIHANPSMAPFSLSPVMGVNKTLRVNQDCWARICLLDDRLERVFYDSMEDGLWWEPIRMENHVFYVQQVKLGEDPENQWAGRRDYEQLLTGNEKSPKMTLHIESPMSFKRGDLHYPLPEPALIFSNLARRWNLFAPFQLPENPDCANVSLSFFNIKTQPFALRKGGTILGSSGKLVFIFKGGENEILYFKTLLRFSFFAGIGVKTTQGMGMVRVK